MTVPRGELLQDAGCGADLRCAPLGSYLENEDKDENDRCFSKLAPQLVWLHLHCDSSPGGAVGRNRPTALQRVAKRDSSHQSASKNQRRNSELETREPELESTDWM